VLVGFIEGLSPLFNGALNVCSHRKVISTRKACKRWSSVFDKLDAINLSLKTHCKRKTICVDMILAKAFTIRDVSRKQLQNLAMAVLNKVVQCDHL